MAGGSKKVILLALGANGFLFPLFHQWVLTGDWFRFPRRFLALTALSRARWIALSERHGAAWEADANGTLWIAVDDEELELVEKKARLYREHGVEAEVLSPQEMERLEPQLRRGFAGALRVPGDRVIYPPLAARWLLERAIDKGARVKLGLEVAAIQDQAVRTTDGTLAAECIVNAAGPHASRLTRGLPIEPRKGHLVITERYPGFCTHQLVELGYLKSAHTMTTESVAFNVQPRLTGQLLIGSSRELVGWDPTINRSIVASMLERAVDFLPGVGRLEAIRTWTGFRPATPDKLPLIGRWPDVDGLWIAAGHEGLGITTALATGEILAALIVGGESPISPGPFDPARFSTEN